MLHLPGERDEAWGPFKKAMLLRKSENIGEKSVFIER
jgi:hypothetical protein